MLSQQQYLLIGKQNSELVKHELFLKKQHRNTTFAVLQLS